MINIKFKPVYDRFHAFGGMRLVREYYRMGLFPEILKRTVGTVARGRSLEHVVYPVYAQVARFLNGRYRPLMLRLKEKYAGEKMGASAPVIWFCWLQGLEQAPEIVHVCLASLRRYVGDKEIRIISLQTYRDYVELPDHVEEKFRKGHIPPALFSDLIRLELLIRYGGTWIDSTVLCTGSHYPKELLDCDLFMFRYVRPGTDEFAGISNWFISARSNHPLLLVLRDMLYQYWRDYDCVLEYYVFHRFFYMLVREFPAVLESMPAVYNPAPLRLVRRFADDFDEEALRGLTASCCFHKTTYRLTKAMRTNAHSFYAEIVRRYS